MINRQKHFLSIKTKLTTISVVSIVSAMLVMLIVMMSYEFYFFRKNQSVDLSVQSNIIADNSAAALAFSDPVATNEVLSALHTSPSLDRAQIFLRDGTPFAEYSKQNLQQSGALERPTWYGTKYTWTKMTLSEDIKFKGSSVGQLVLEANFNLLYQHIFLYGGIALLAVVVALIFATLMLRPLIRSITQPILNMNYMMRHISNNIDYSGRMDHISSDEVGELATGFNEMLQQMQLAEMREESQSNIMRMLANHKPLGEVLEAIVTSGFSENTEYSNKGAICCFWLLNNDSTQFCRSISLDLPDFYIDYIKELKLSNGLTPCATAVATGKPVIIENIQAHPYDASYKALASKVGVTACWTYPVITSTGKVQGVFSVYFNESLSPKDSDIAIIEQYADLASIAIERDRAESELTIAATAFQSQESLLITDANCIILRVNPAFTQSTGYPADEVIGKNAYMFKSNLHPADFYLEMWDSIHKTGAWQGEIWARRKNGEVYPKWLTISAVSGKDGVVSHYVGSGIDITQRKAAEEEIRNLAFYDSLTGLPNRRLLIDRLKHALAASARSKMYGAVLFLDLDNFKTLNDTLGHDVGDLLLQQVAKRLSATSREDDTIARIGGDEFVVILENLSDKPMEAAEHAKVICDKYLSILNESYTLSKYECLSSPSIGVTLFNDHQSGIEELLKQADIAMYQAKKAGRNAIRFFDPKMQDAINHLVNLDRELRVAIERQQFQLYFQVQVDIAGRPLGAEVLIRWIHPEHGTIFPPTFIPLAEDNGLIFTIGKWVLDMACAQLKAWELEASTRNLKLSINVSAKQFHQADFIKQVKTAIKNHAINPAMLKLELTESMLLDNIEDTIRTMNILKEIGIQFSLDDFGTGYSSLQYLKQLPLTQLKIDKSFVHDIAVDNSDQAIVRTTIVMAQTLNLEVIAEGVETIEQRNVLINSGCTCFQGFLFGQPMPIEQFVDQVKLM
ncbi:EAL domain-containing protein [Methylotenera versatilis]|uniref:Diguanylate cyclase/phosphodiesterase with PAS/PAC and GAF sensor(S) n=1 Tax=Methylotenera versatilis (strain 301) TaxID=666681 RepID=D7DIF8_METV0|nr:EAL domain-containing protein [Methylotenera versatilis]ADI29843.1 diguanylate cyclase/phosphodiesterase with PAS/PAC and GAF sensor(s) [Methylotenera versatilis 301]